jgi:hypothetical protein
MVPQCPGAVYGSRFGVGFTEEECNLLQGHEGPCEAAPFMADDRPTCTCGHMARSHMTGNAAGSPAASADSGERSDNAGCMTERNRR